jgi:hypothetical protein
MKELSSEARNVTAAAISRGLSTRRAVEGDGMLQVLLLSGAESGELRHR